MQKIDLEGIFKEHNILERGEIAQLLFPGNQHPKNALWRVLRGDAVLDADQVSKLAAFIGVEPGDLYTTEGWKSNSSKNMIVFERGDYRVRLFTETGMTQIFHKKSMFHQAVIHSGATPLTEYLKQIDLLILKFRENESR